MGPMNHRLLASVTDPNTRTLPITAPRMYPSGSGMTKPRPLANLMPSRSTRSDAWIHIRSPMMAGGGCQLRFSMGLQPITTSQAHGCLRLSASITAPP
jgi:hypothetical protein